MSNTIQCKNRQEWCLNATSGSLESPSVTRESVCHQISIEKEAPETDMYKGEKRTELSAGIAESSVKRTEVVSSQPGIFWRESLKERAVKSNQLIARTICQILKLW